MNLVTAGVVTWNHENYILQCLESIVNQDYKPTEIIVIDNCSKDRTYETAKQLLDNCGIPYSLIRNEKPLPLSRNCNLLLEKVTGDYISLISGDDWMTNRNLSAKLTKMLSDPQIGAVHSEAYVFVEPDHKIIAERAKRPEGWVFDELVKGNFITGPGVLMDVAKVKEVGSFNENIAIEDWDLWLRLSQKYKIGFVDEFLVYYRRHTSNFSSRNNPVFLNSMLNIIEQYKGHKNYAYCKQQIVYQQFWELSQSKGGLRNLWQTLRIQDGSIFRLNILKHNILKLFKKSASITEEI